MGSLSSSTDAQPCGIISHLNDIILLRLLLSGLDVGNLNLWMRRSDSENNGSRTRQFQIIYHTRRQLMDLMKMLQPWNYFSDGFHSTVFTRVRTLVRSPTSVDANLCTIQRLI
jgi:hypothetical protein